MHNLARNLEQYQPCLAYGHVVAEAAQGFTVQTDEGLIPAVAAAGCLMAPMPGDRVLLTTDGETESYILTVLRRAPESAAPARLVFDRPVDLVVNGGGFSVAADEGLALASPGTISMAAGKISMHAGCAEAAIEKIALIGKSLQGRIKRIKLVANTVENTFRRLTQRLQDAFRFVEDQEEIQTGSTRYLVEDTLTMNARNAVHMAEEIVTINAEQVHLG